MSETRGSTVTIGGIELRFVDGMLERRFSEETGWRIALYTSVAPDEAEAYAAFVRANRDASRVSGSHP